MSVRSDDNGRQEMEDRILAPYYYLCQMSGQEIRAKLAKAFNHWLRIDDKKLLLIGEIVQMLHNASLMIDDIEDNSILRRSLPVVHSIYGVPRTINAANYVYFLALNKCLQLEHSRATIVYSEQLIELHRGQGKELYWRDTVTCPTVEDYEKMVVQKTGGLFGLAVRLMQLFSDNQSDFKSLIDMLGLYFQLRDDYANLCSSEYAEKKTYAEDLTEGKFSFPIIHAIENDKNDGQIINILRQKTTAFEVKQYCVKLLEKSGSFEFTRQKLKNLQNSIKSKIKEFGGNQYLITILEELNVIHSDNSQ